jgi:AraC family transcriptional regulator
MVRRGNPVSFGSPQFATVGAGPFLVTDAWFPPHASLPCHYHDRAIVAVTVAGQGNSILGTHEIALDAGTLHTEPAGDRHSNQFGAHGARVVVVQPDPGAVELFRSCQPLVIGIHRLVLPEPPALARRLRAEISRPDTLSPFAIESACLELLASGTRAINARSAGEQGSARWIPRIIDFLEAHFLECPTVDQLSAVAGVHPAHFARVFRSTFKQSPATYVRRLRLEWAARALAQTDQPLVDIATASGFADQSHFTRAFRRHVGRTPAAYRRAAVTKVAGTLGQRCQPPRSWGR